MKFKFIVCASLLALNVAPKCENIKITTHEQTDCSDEGKEDAATLKQLNYAFDSCFGAEDQYMRITCDTEAMTVVNYSDRQCQTETKSE